MGDPPWGERPAGHPFRGMGAPVQDYNRTPPSSPARRSLADRPPPRRRNPGSRLDLGRRAVDRFVDRAAGGTAPGARVLDLGAGEGRYRERFGGRRYVAVDLALGDARWDYGDLDV